MEVNTVNYPYRYQTIYCRDDIKKKRILKVKPPKMLNKQINKT